MKFTLSRVVKQIGLDGAIAYTSLFRLLQAAGGLITVFFVANYLNEIEQGYYYTFISLTGLQVFFELGLNSVIVQFVAHETSHLHLDIGGKILGEAKYISRLSYLLRFCFKWYMFFSVFLIVGLLLLGVFFFESYSHADSQLEWRSPWLCLCVLSALNLLISPIFSFLQGLGKVKEIAQLRFFQQILVYGAVAYGFIFGYGLFVPAINLLVLIISGIALILTYKFDRILKFIWLFPASEEMNYFKDIFPFQWKIAISWASGYFIYQAFSPILFVFEGPELAGKMGMTMAILNGVQGLSNSWMTTKTPVYARLIAKKQYVELDRLFDKTMMQSVSIISLTLLLVFCLLVLFEKCSISFYSIRVDKKIIGKIPLVFLILTAIMNQITFSWALYLRSHKKEPYLLYSVVMALLIVFSTYILTDRFGILGMTGGYFVVTLIMFTWARNIFYKSKSDWHV